MTVLYFIYIKMDNNANYNNIKIVGLVRNTLERPMRSKEVSL